jgi:hypothetical protein
MADASHSVHRPIDPQTRFPDLARAATIRFVAADAGTGGVLHLRAAAQTAALRTGLALLPKYLPVLL